MLSLLPSIHLPFPFQHDKPCVYWVLGKRDVQKGPQMRVVRRESSTLNAAPHSLPGGMGALLCDLEVPRQSRVPFYVLSRLC